MTYYLFLTVLLVTCREIIAFKKVLVQAVYKEWEHGKPHWVTNQTLQEKLGFTVFAYQKLDPSAPNYFGYNRGTETGVYLKYIVDHYDDFPDVAIFTHARPHEHVKYWLEMIGNISPNATYYNINFGDSPYVTRDPSLWKPYSVPVEQCWRDVLQILHQLKGQDEKFLELFPPKYPLISSGVCCNQFILGRSTVHRRPLSVWSELLNIFAIQPACHLGEPNYEHLHEFNVTGRVKTGPEIDIVFEPNTLFANEHKLGTNIPGAAGEHLSHVIFGSLPLMSEYPDNQAIFCQTFLPLRPGSPCRTLPSHPVEELFQKTIVLKVMSSSGRYWFMVLHRGVRHNIPDMDTYNGLEVNGDDVYFLNLNDVHNYKEGPPVEACDRDAVPNKCVESMFYKALHHRG